MYTDTRQKVVNQGLRLGEFFHPLKVVNGTGGISPWDQDDEVIEELKQGVMLELLYSERSHHPQHPRVELFGSQHSFFVFVERFLHDRRRGEEEEWDELLSMK